MNKLLLSLRVFTLTLLLFIIINPSKTITEDKKEKDIIAVLVDVSASMDINDNQHRFTLVKDFIKSSNINELSKKYSLEYYAFSEIAQKTSREKILSMNKPTGKITDIGLAIEQVSYELGFKNLNGIILITDGADNAANPIRIPNKANPIYAIGVGSSTKNTDISIADIRTPEFAFKGIATDIPIIIKSNGFKGKIPIMLKRNNSLLEKKELEIIEDKEYTVNFKIKPNETGTFNYSVIIPKQTNETFHKNNEKAFSVKVIKDKIRTLLISGRPSWEYRFLRDFLKNDPNVELVTFVILRNPTNISIFPENELTLIHFPATELFTKELFNFDLLIFENFTYTRFIAPNLLENIKKFVIEKGGAFLMTGGENSFGKGGYKGTAIEEILPVEIDAKEEIIEKEFNVKLVNKTHPVINYEEMKIPAEEIENITLYGINKTKIKKDSIPLGTYRYNLSEELPVIALSEKGKGKVMAITSPTTWKWKFANDKENKSKLYDNFWKNTIRWLVNSPNLKPLQMNTDKNSYIKDEEVTINIKTFNEYFQPADNEITIIIEKPYDKNKIMDKPERTDKGEYKYQFNPDEEGKYKITASFQRTGKTISETVYFDVTVKSLELSDSYLHEEFLKEISGKTKGQYIHINNINKEKLNISGSAGKKDAKAIKKKINLGRNIIVFILILSSIITELFLRRKKGYV